MKKKSDKIDKINLNDYQPESIDEKIIKDYHDLDKKVENPIEWFDQDTGEPLDTLVFANPNQKNNIIIDFNKAFDRKDLTLLESFNIDRRCFYKIIDFIINTLNYVFNMDKDLILIYLKIYTELTEKLTDEENPITENEFKDIIFENFLKNKKLLDICDDLIEKSYTISLDSETGKKINTDLQVTDQNNKAVLKTAMVMRFLIPLLCLYKKNKQDKVFLFTANYLIKYYSGGSTRVLNKLFKIIDSRVQCTTISDKVFWGYGKSLNITPTLVTNDIRKSILKQIIPKIVPNTSIIKFLDVVIRFKVQCTFTYNYKWKYKPIKTDAQEDIDDKERMEFRAFTLKHNEADIMLNEIAIKQQISKILKDYDYDKDDIKQFIENIKYINSIQKYFLDVYYFNQFKVLGDTSDKAILLYHMIQDLKNKNFIEIPRILEGKLEDDTIPLASNSMIKNKMKPATRLESYKKLLTDYSQFLDIISKKNFVATIFSSSSYTYYDPLDEKMEIDSDLYLIECIKFIDLLG